MTTLPTPRRFASPVFVRNMEELLRRSRRNLALGVLIALVLHVFLVVLNPFKRPPDQASRPVATRFLKREPNLTKPLELRKMPVPTRQLEQREVHTSQARMDQVQATAAFNTRNAVAQAAGPKVTMTPQVNIQAANLEPALAAVAISGNRQPENKIDMALEMLDVNSMDTGRYRAMVVQDATDRQAIKGFINMALVISARSVAAGTVGYTSIGVRDVDAICDAVNEYTGLKARFIGQITYDDNRLLEVPIIYPVGTPNESEKENLARYLLAGGFVFGWLNEFQEILEKYGGLAAGQDFWQERLTDKHPLFSAFFDIKGGGGLSGLSEASLGNQKQGMDTWMSMQGFFIKGRLAGIWMSHGGSWLLGGDYNADSTRPMQMAVNVVVYALTQEGSITQHLMQMVR